MIELYLTVLIFVVPFCLAVYIWRDQPPKQAVYYICFSVSTLAVIILVLGNNILAAIMPIGLFWRPQVFLPGFMRQAILRKIRILKKNSTAQDDPS